MDDLTGKIRDLLSDEESMRQIKELAEMFGGAGGDSAPQETPSDASQCGAPDGGGLNIDPFAIMKLAGSFSQKDEACELIAALKPFLSADKQNKADRAMKMLRLYNVFTALKDSGMLSELNL